MNYNSFLRFKNNIYHDFKTKSDSPENLKKRSKELLKQVSFVTDDESIIDPEWIVNVSELIEFIQWVDYSYYKIPNNWDPDLEKKRPIRYRVREHEFELWDRLYNNNIYSTYDCNLEIDFYHNTFIAHYQYLRNYKKTGLFQLKPIGVYLEYLNRNKKEVDSYPLPNRYKFYDILGERCQNAYLSLLKYRYDLKNDEGLQLRKSLIQIAESSYNLALNHSNELHDNRLSSVLYFKLMRCKERSRQCSARFSISRYGDFINSKEKNNYKKFIFNNSLFKASYYSNLLKLLTLKTLRYICGYGEKPQYVIVLGVFVVTLFSILYLVGGFQINGDIVNYNLDFRYTTSFVNYQFIEDVLDSFYFSTITFTTLGYGDSSPIGVSKLFSSIESLLGAIFISLFIFTLARQVQR